MNKGAKGLIPVVTLVTTLSLVGAVLVFAGFPMAGTESALIGAAVASVMTLLMAFAFSHSAKPGH